jgi:ABC-2 type transport system ATP-binding protein
MSRSYPDVTAHESLAFLGRSYRLHGALLEERVSDALELTDLSDRAGDRADSFSGGTNRRLNTAAGLLNHPVLLVLDEPTVGVDP